MPNEEPMIRVQDVKFRYDPEQPAYAVDGVSLNVRRGEFVAVLGANGCGKSTLAKHFNAILLPEAGTVLVENMDTRGEDHLYDIRQKVGMVFQNPDNQIVATIVEEDVAFAPENLGVPPEEIRTRIDEAMKLAGIYEKLLRISSPAGRSSASPSRALSPCVRTAWCWTKPPPCWTPTAAARSCAPSINCARLAFRSCPSPIIWRKPPRPTAYWS